MLMITTPAGTPSGNYSITVTGVSGGLTHTFVLTLTVSTSLNGLPTGWSTQDLAPAPANMPTGASYSGGAFVVSGTGCCLSGTNDSARFVYQPLNGDGTIIAHLANATNFSGTAKAGVMIREALTQESTNAFMGLQSDRGLAFQGRLSTLAGTFSGTGPVTSAPYWFKLVRSGNTFSGYSSSDGSNWALQNSQTISMANTVYVGLAVTSENSAVLTTATFDNVFVLSSANTTPDFYLGLPIASTTVAGGGSLGYPKVFVSAVNGFSDAVSLSVSGFPTGASGSFSPPSITGSGPSLLTITTTSSTPSGSYPITITGVSGSLTHTAILTLSVGTAATTLPSPWTNQDIGPPGTGTGSSYSSGVFTVSGMGCCLSGQLDSAQFAYQTVSGDVTIIGRVASTTNFTGTAKTGLVMRDTLAPDAMNAFMGLESDRGLAYQARLSPLGGTFSASGPMASAPYWFKLVRSGSTLTGYSSTDGITWSLQNSQSVPMGTTIYIGLVVSSESSSVLTTATFDNVTITQP
jgi:hypothetical protein